MSARAIYHRELCAIRWRPELDRIQSLEAFLDVVRQT
jgi:hypothetical protein